MNEKTYAQQSLEEIGRLEALMVEVSDELILAANGRLYDETVKAYARIRQLEEEQGKLIIQLLAELVQGV